MITTSNNRLTRILATRQGASYAVGIVTLLMVVIMLFLAILPAYRSITDQIKSNETKLKYLQDLKTKKSSMDDLLKQYNDNTDLIKQFEAYYKNKTNNEMLLANLDLIAGNNNCILENATFKQVGAPKAVEMQAFAGIQAQPFDISFKGQLPDLNNVIKHLEEFPVTLRYNDLSYSHVKSAGSQVDVPVSQDYLFTLNLMGEYYFWQSQN